MTQMRKKFGIHMAQIQGKIYDIATKVWTEMAQGQGNAQGDEEESAEERRQVRAPPEVPEPSEVERKLYNITHFPFAVWCRQVFGRALCFASCELTRGRHYRN